MSGVILTPYEMRALEITNKIKSYTFKTPSDKGIADPDYKRYLAICSRLFELDCSLHSLFYTYDEMTNDEEFASFEERLIEIEKEVDKLVK